MEENRARQAREEAASGGPNAGAAVGTPAEAVGVTSTTGRY